MDFAIRCIEKSKFCSLNSIVIADEFIRKTPQPIKIIYHKSVVLIPKLSYIITQL